MKKHYFLLLLILLMGLNEVTAQTLWQGPKITFIKPGNADWTLEENQDRITPNVWITRKSNQSIFNIKTESGYSASVSPADTEWGYGTTADIGSIMFANWNTWAAGNPSGTIGQDAVVHLISEDIYIDIKFLSWLNSSNGAEFSYERSTESPPLSTDEFSLEGVRIYMQDENKIRITGIENEKAQIALFSILGKQIMQDSFEGIGMNDIAIPISLKTGIYIIKLITQRGELNKKIFVK